MDPKVGWLSRYPPAHSLWLVPGVWINQPRIMVALAAALSVWFVSGSVACLGGSALAVCLALLFSPFFQFMNGTLLSHTSGLMAVSVLWWAYVRWQTSGRTGFAAVAGLAWAFLFLNRTYTGTLIALPLGVDAMVRLGLHWRRRPQWVGTILFGLFALVGVGVYLLYNYLALGDPFRSTYLYYDDRWRLGFDGDHRIWDGLQMMWSNLLLLDRWLWGVPGSLLVVMAALVIGGSAAWTPVCVAGILAVVGGYAAFSYPGANTCGPYYYFETIPFLFTLVGLAVARIRRWRRGRGLLVVLTLVLIVASLSFMKHEAGRTHKERGRHTRAQAALAKAPSNALVFVSGFKEEDGLHLFLYPRGVHSDPLVVAGWKKRNVLVTRMFPDRACYQLRPGMDRVEPYTPDPPVLVYEIFADDCESSTGFREPETEGTSAALAANALRDKAGCLARGDWMPVIAGPYRLLCRLSYDGVEPTAPLFLEVAAESDGRRVVQRALSGSATNSDVAVLFDMPGYDQVEPRLYFGGSGHVVFHHFRLEDAPPSAPLPAPDQDESGTREIRKEKR